MNTKNFKIILILFLVCSILFLHTDMLKAETKVQPRLYYTFFNYPVKDNFDKSGLRIYIQVPYDDLLFVNIEDYYKSTYEVNVIVREGDNTVLDRTFQTSFSILDYDNTNLDSLYIFWEKSFELNPNKYQVEIIFTDKNSNNVSKGKFPVELKKFDEGSVNVSDILFLRKIEFLKNDVVKIFPALLNNFSHYDKEFYAYFEMYIPDKYNAVDIKYNIFNEFNKDKLFKDGMKSFTKKKDYDFFYTDIKDLNLDMGKYIIEYQLGYNGEKKTNGSSFSMGWEGLPMSISDFDKAIDELKYVASKKEMNKIKEAKGNEKLEAFKSFWANRNPKPYADTDAKMREYYRRIDYATRNFPAPKIPDSWMTDRGYIYVIMGEPDDIYRQMIDTRGNPPYEIWYYYSKNRAYLFIDKSSFGDYVLLSTIYYEDSDMLR